jgi:hypothetical protein
LIQDASLSYTSLETTLDYVCDLKIEQYKLPTILPPNSYADSGYGLSAHNVAARAAHNNFDVIDETLAPVGYAAV